MTPDEMKSLLEWAREFSGPGSAGVNELADALEAERGHVQSLAKWVGVPEDTPSLEIALEVSSALEAALPFLHPEPSEDEREALDWLWGYSTGIDYDPTRAAFRDRLNALTRRPTPDREQIARLIDPDAWREPILAETYRESARVESLGIADAVLALFATPGGDS